MGCLKVQLKKEIEKGIMSSTALVLAVAEA